MRTQKPPVDTVLSDMFTESNSGMPPRSSRTICTTVIAIYISYKSFADFCMRGTSFAAIGPGNSARSRNIEPPSRATGAIASRKTSTPMPPIQLVMLRQSSMARGAASTSSMIVAPVVEKPDIVSNTASDTLPITPEA